jgi:hypothetical protein
VCRGRGGRGLGRAFVIVVVLAVVLAYPRGRAHLLRRREEQPLIKITLAVEHDLIVPR